MRKNINLSLAIMLLFVSVFCWNANAQTSSVFSVEEVSYPIFFNGNKIHFQSPVLNAEGRTYVHIRELSDLFGYKISWDETENMILIDTAVKEHQISKELALEIAKLYLQEKYPEFMKDVTCWVDEGENCYQITCGPYSQIISSTGESVVIPRIGGCVTVSIDKENCRILSEIWGE